MQNSDFVTIPKAPGEHWAANGSRLCVAHIQASGAGHSNAITLLQDQVGGAMLATVGQDMISSDMTGCDILRCDMV